MGQIKETIRQYKWVLVAGLITALLIGLIAANFHVLQFMKYKMSNDTQGMLRILQTAATHQESENEWYFKQGMTYLIEQDVYTEEIKHFFEDNFSYFTEERKKEIVAGYNKRKLSFALTEEWMRFLIDCREDGEVKQYMKQMPPDALEAGLLLVYGKTPKVDEPFIQSLNEILAAYPQKLPFQKFKFSLYDLLQQGGTPISPEVKQLFAKIDPKIVRTDLFKELSTKQLTEKQLLTWMKFFKDCQVISLSDYTAFDKLYSEIDRLRSEYKGLDDEKIQLQNKKESVEAQISETSKTVEGKKEEVSQKQQEVAALESKLEKLTNYAHMSLYVEEASGTGTGEYIASIPRGGLFGFKPSSQKYIVKLTHSSVFNQGVLNLNVYLQGVKQAQDGSKYDYYVEVSPSDLSEMDSLTAERTRQIEALEALQQEVKRLEDQITAIKEENYYDEAVEALNNIESRRSDYVSQMTEKVVGIKELFGFSDIMISIDGSEQ